MLIDEAETVDDAEHERLLAKAEAEGIGPTFEERVTDVAGAAGHARHARDVRADRRPARAGRAARWRWRPTLDGLPDHDDIENVVVLGMGGSGIAGDVAGRRRRAVHAGAGRRDARATSRPRSSARARCASPSRSRATPRRRSRRPARRPRPGPAWSWSPGGGELAELAECVAGAVHRACPTTSRCRGPASARVSIPPLVVLEDVGLFPGRPGVDRPGRRAAAPPPRPAGRRRQRGRATWPGASAARSRSSTAAATSVGVAALRWKTQVNENAKAPAFSARSPSCATTRSAAGASTATSPARCSPLVNLRHDHEHPQVMRRFDLVARGRSTRSWPGSRRCGPRARARWPSCSTSSCSATSSTLHLALPGGHRPRPDPGPRRAQGRARRADRRTSVRRGRHGDHRRPEDREGRTASRDSIDASRLQRDHPCSETDFKVADLSLAAVRPQGDRAGRARDARPHGPAGRVRRRPAARRRPHHRLAAHDGPDRGAHRDARRASAPTCAGRRCNIFSTQDHAAAAVAVGPRARSTTPGHAGLRVEGRDARGVLVVHRAGPALARRRGGPEHDPRRRRRRHAARAQGRRVRGGRGRARRRTTTTPTSGRSSSRSCSARSPRSPSCWTRVADGHQGRLRGDHDRRPPALPDDRGGHAAVPGHQRQRLGHQVEVRQPLRLPPLAHRRHQPRPPT